MTVIGPDGNDLASWWLVGDGSPDLAVAESLARLALSARRRGVRIRLDGVDARLEDLLELTGLRGQLLWEPERREQELGVEEGVEPADPIT